MFSPDYVNCGFWQVLETSLGKEETLRKDLEGQLAKLMAEKNELFMQLQAEKNSLNTSEERSQKLNAQRADLERQVQVD